MEDINASLRSSLSGATDGVRNIFPKALFLNARSIQNKVFDLQALLFIVSFYVVIVEAWLDCNYQDFELKLEGYNVFRKDRCNRRGDGVLIGIRNHISCIHRSDFEVMLEMIALEIRPNPTICVLLSAFYRQLDTDELFLHNLESFWLNIQELVFQILLFLWTLIEFHLHNYTRTLSVFPYVRTQHVRRMRSSIVCMMQTILKFRFMCTIPHSRLNGR